MRFLQVLMLILVAVITMGMRIQGCDGGGGSCDNDAISICISLEFNSGSCGSVDPCPYEPADVKYGTPQVIYSFPHPTAYDSYQFDPKNPGLPPQLVRLTSNLCFMGKKGSSPITVYWACHDNQGNLKQVCETRKIFMTPQVPCETSVTQQYVIPVTCRCD